MALRTSSSACEGVDDLALAHATRPGLAHTDDVQHSFAIDLAHHRTNLRGADLQTHDNG